MAAAPGQLGSSVEAVTASRFRCVPLPRILRQEAEVHALQMLQVPLEVCDVALVALITEVPVDLEPEAGVRVRAVAAVRPVDL